jgi:MoxR-like ATPase
MAIESLHPVQEQWDDFRIAQDTAEKLSVGLSQEVHLDKIAMKTLVGTMAVENTVALMEGPYGIGKTTIAKAMAGLSNLSFGRVQGHPDVTPSDIIGVHSYNPDADPEDEDKRFPFHAGPIFNNVVLIDEAHRIPNKPQAAFIEAFEEGQVTTTRGKGYLLPNPRVTLLTKNPDGEGIIGAVTDRISASLYLPDQNAETRAAIMNLKKQNRGTNIHIADGEIANMQAQTKEVHVPDAVEHKANTLLDVVFEDDRVDVDESITGGFRSFWDINQFAKFSALKEGRRQATETDIMFGALAALSHRTTLRYEAMEAGVKPNQVIAQNAIAHLGLAPRKA